MDFETARIRGQRVQAMHLFWVGVWQGVVEWEDDADANGTQTLRPLLPRSSTTLRVEVSGRSSC